MELATFLFFYIYFKCLLAIYSFTIPVVTQKLAAGLHESALKSTTAGFANAPVLIQYEDVCDRRFQGTLTQPKSQFLSDERYVF